MKESPDVATSITLRAAREADIPAMSAIRLAVTENRLTDPSRVTLQMYRDYLEEQGRGWVCELDGVIVGFAYADKDDASIWALFVSPEHEGHGIGKRLLALAVDYLFFLGHNEITLSTGADTRADVFYASQGWERGRMKNDVEVRYTLQKESHDHTA